MAAEHDGNQFTEDAFRGHLRAPKAAGYAFAGFARQDQGRQVLWRHDVDVSMHRAARLARIQAEEGVQGAYSVDPRCVFYSLAEPEIAAALATEITGLGHEVGLLTPSERIDRCIQGRAMRIRGRYDADLKGAGRDNLGAVR